MDIFMFALILGFICIWVAAGYIIIESDSATEG